VPADTPVCRLGSLDGSCQVAGEAACPVGQCVVFATSSFRSLPCCSHVSSSLLSQPPPPPPSPSQMLRDAADCDVDGSAYAQVRASRQLALVCRAQAACAGRRCGACRHAAFAFASRGGTKEVVAEASVWGNSASAAAPWLFRRRWTPALLRVRACRL
jgi:hypothetical protein